MDAEEFIRRWSRSELKERAAAQTHFNDLCLLLGIDPPIAADPHGEWFVFEKATRRRGKKRGFADVYRRGYFAWEYKGPRKDLEEALDQLRQYAHALNYPKLLVTSDTKTIRVVTAFNDTAEAIYQFELPDLRNPTKIEQLRLVFEDPDRLKPGVTPAHVTEQAAGHFRIIIDSLRLEGHEARVAAHFATQLLFCLFAEDIGILEGKDFREILKEARDHRETLVPALSDLFARMDSGGLFGAHRIPYFNGRLFEVHEALPLSEVAFAALNDAANLHWSDIHPAIFGTLFERGMNPEKAQQVGRHYTDPEKILKIINPVIVEPLRQEWEAVLAQITSRRHRKQRAAAQRLYGQFVHRLTQLKILDPACGSGNFLYLALQALKNLEHQAGLDAEAAGLQRELPQIDPSILYGIDIDEYAVELARVTIWIGQIQWMKLNGYGRPSEPILPQLENIECRDALLNEDGIEAEWPEANFIVGNPPFLGSSKMIRRLGEGYVSRLRALFAGRLPGGADLVCYWFEKARAQMEARRAHRAGLVATDSIRGGASRRVLERISASSTIFNAWSSEKWIIEGAAVRVSLVVFSVKSDIASKHIRLDGETVDIIHSDLTGRKGRVGVDLTHARPLHENHGVAFIGTQKNGAFDIPGELARAWILEGGNPNGRSNADVVRPWRNGMDVLRRPSDRWIIDFGSSLSEHEASLYVRPFQYVHEHVRPSRALVHRAWRREHWWLFGEPMPRMRQAISSLKRFIVVPRIARHLVFAWLPADTIPDCQLVVIACDDDSTFGVLHSRVHRVWARRMGTALEDRPRYTPSTTFETFPFPDGLAPNLASVQFEKTERGRAIAAAARELEQQRQRWLTPLEWVDSVPEPVPDYPHRMIPKPEYASKLRERTLTRLYNENPAWLAKAHQKLDRAVASAYGWDGELSDERVLEQLLALNDTRERV